MPVMLLRLNAASCVLFGALFVLAPGAVARFLGAAPASLILVLGLGLLANGGHLLWAARRTVPAVLLKYFALLDALWVVATAVLILAGLWITSPGGIVAALVVAVTVAALGLMQWRAATGSEGRT